MPNVISFPFLGGATSPTFTITLLSLASSVVGVGRQSTMIDNSTDNRGAAIVTLRLRTGTTPTINRTFKVYLIQSDDSTGSTVIRSDGAGASDAALTIVNARLLGTMRMNSASSGQDFTGSFDTWLIAPLGLEWGRAIVHDTAVNLDGTEANHLKHYRYYDPQIED